MNKPHLRYKYQTPRERTWTIHFIAAEKAIKGSILIIVGFKLLTLFNRDVHAWAEDFVTRHGIDIANRYVQPALERLSGVGNRQLAMFSVGAFIYAALLFTEGIGLWLQKRWAEYLTAFATALFIPIEIYEIYARLTWVRIAILMLNVFVVWYLATRLRDEKKEKSATDFTNHNVIEGTRVKICGMVNLEDALFAIEAGADELGFNFYKKSSRYISPQNAKAIIDELPSSVFKIGVFVNEPIKSILKTLKIARLDAIQLHGDESYEYVTDLHSRTNIEIIKAVRVKPGFDWRNAMDFDAHAILFDSFSRDEYGGSGNRFDWKIAKDAVVMIPYLYLAGGLLVDNVAEAIRTVRPYAVDVASGVESSPGKKDTGKVAAFIKAAKEAL